MNSSVIYGNPALIQRLRPDLAEQLPERWQPAREAAPIGPLREGMDYRGWAEAAVRQLREGCRE